MEIPILMVDAFASEAFRGNSAAVCLLARTADADWMQKVAAEMNLSITAFVVAREAGDGFDLRWFTPTREIPLCGHGTLAATHALYELGPRTLAQEVRFHTASGELECRRVQEKIEMDFPALHVHEAPLNDLVAKALGGITPKCVRINRRKDGSDGNYLIELNSATEVRDLRPDFSLLRQFKDAGVIVTAAGDGPYDFTSRFFACYAGIDEDPVTGSAHCMLATYWAQKLGKTELRAYQASARGGEVDLTLNGDRVLLRGPAVTIMRGHLLTV